MFKPNHELGEQNQEKKQRALAEIKKFAADWEMAHIICLGSGQFLVERLDEQGEQLGLYDFNDRGDLISFNIKEGPSELNNIINDFEQSGIGAQVIDLKRQKPKSAEAVK